MVVCVCVCVMYNDEWNIKTNHSSARDGRLPDDSGNEMCACHLLQRLLESGKHSVTPACKLCQASTNLKSDTGSELDGQVPVNVEGQQYADSKAYVMIDITLTRPLVPKRPPEELARRSVHTLLVVSPETIVMVSWT